MVHTYKDSVEEVEPEEGLLHLAKVDEPKRLGGVVLHDDGLVLEGEGQIR